MVLPIGTKEQPKVAIYRYLRSALSRPNNQLISPEIYPSSFDYRSVAMNKKGDVLVGIRSMKDGFVVDYMDISNRNFAVNHTYILPEVKDMGQHVDIIFLNEDQHVLMYDQGGTFNGEKYGESIVIIENITDPGQSRITRVPVGTEEYFRRSHRYIASSPDGNSFVWIEHSIAQQEDLVNTPEYLKRRVPYMCRVTIQKHRVQVERLPLHPSLVSYQDSTLKYNDVCHCQGTTLTWSQHGPWIYTNGSINRPSGIIPVIIGINLDKPTDPPSIRTIGPPTLNALIYKITDHSVIILSNGILLSMEYDHEKEEYTVTGTYGRYDSLSDLLVTKLDGLVMTDNHDLLMTLRIPITTFLLEPTPIYELIPREVQT